MPFTAQAALSEDGRFVEKVEMTAVTYALTVMAEAGSVSGHADRAKLAHAVLRASQEWGKRLAVGMAADSALNGNDSDAIFLARMAAIWNAYAGITAAAP